MEEIFANRKEEGDRRGGGEGDNPDVSFAGLLGRVAVRELCA